MIEAKIITDSISPAGKRITTFVLTYPRFIHAEFMTHRMLSRNAASSRAIPVKKMLEEVRKNPAMPEFWGRNQSGMQAKEELALRQKQECIDSWLKARDFAIQQVEIMQAVELHKQIANRILEPWFHMRTICTATEWENFYFLRRDTDAQPEIKILADRMWEAHEASTPEQNTLHIPYVSNNELEQAGPDSAKKFSAARCARVSYLNHDGTKPTPEKDLDLFSKLVVRDDPNKPGHWSPLEHVATAMSNSEERSGNFHGWLQYRKEFPTENRTKK